MTVTVEVTAEVRRLFFGEHWKKGTIAAQLGIHPDVVTRVLGSFGPKAGTPRPDARVLEPYVDFVDETLRQYPRLVCTRIHDMIVERGYTGALRTLRRHVALARPQPKAEVFVRLETLPGEQAQIDWAHVGTLPVPGGTRPLWAFIMVLAHSRAMWGELVVALDVWSLRRSLVRAADFFGGSPRQWLFDNAKTIVVERRGDAVRFHDDLLDLAARLHVQPRLCAPRRPQEKGKVERAIRYLKDRFFPARSFHSLAHGNAQLLTFLRDVANVRPHPRWPDRTVADVFDEEKARLLSLPDPLPSIELVAPITVDKTAFVRLDTNRYSVPSETGRGVLTLAATDSVIRLLDGDREVASHERSWGRHQVFERKEHRAGLLAHKRKAQDLKGRDRLHAELPGIDTLIDRWVDHGRNLGSMIGRTVKLLNAYGAHVTAAAVAEMIQRGTHDIGALAILCEQHRRVRPSSEPALLDLADHVVERDVVPHDLGGYDE
jgi:transposase